MIYPSKLNWFRTLQDVDDYVDVDDKDGDDDDKYGDGDVNDGDDVGAMVVVLQIKP